MKMTKLFGRRYRDVPKEAQSTAQAFLLRGGYVRLMDDHARILLPLGLRVKSKIEVLLSKQFADSHLSAVELPAATESPVVRLTNLVAAEVDSYKQLPATLSVSRLQGFHERPAGRLGQWQVAELAVVKAYASENERRVASAEDGRRVAEALGQLGLAVTCHVMADGAIDYLTVAPDGPCALLVSTGGTSLATHATPRLDAPLEDPKPLSKVHTPGTRTIAEVANFLNVGPEQTAKAVFYDAAGDLILVVVRGDREVSEAKLKHHLGIQALVPAAEEAILRAGAVPGFASPMGLDLQQVTIILDPSLLYTPNLVAGANDNDYHYTNFNVKRELADVLDQLEVIDVTLAQAGDRDDANGEVLQAGNGYHLGRSCCPSTRQLRHDGTFLDRNGKRQVTWLAIHQLQVDAIMAAVIAQSHDDYGPIWPFAIAPFQVHLCALNLKKDGVREAAERLYRELTANGVEVLFDDRGEKPGVMFNDADLIGVPYRLILSPKTMADGEVELKTRDQQRVERMPLDTAADALSAEINGRLASY